LVALTLAVLVVAPAELLAAGFTVTLEEADCPAKVAVTDSLPAAAPTRSTAQVPDVMVH
jgi:hypothetical protein